MAPTAASVGPLPAFPVADDGDGPPVLLLHGTAPGTTADGNFAALRPELAGYRTLAPDLLGFGAAAKPLDLPYGPELWARQAWRLLDERGLDRVVVVGNSMGARVALTMALAAPARIRGLALLSTRVLPSSTPAQALLRSYRPDPAAMERLVRECFVSDPSVVTPEQVRRRYEASAAPGAHAAMQAVFAGLAADPGPAADDLATISAPTVLLQGRDDRVVPAENALRLAELLPHADVHLLAGTGHWLQIERAALVGALLRDFLARCPA